MSNKETKLTAKELVWLIVDAILYISFFLVFIYGFGKFIKYYSPDVNIKFWLKGFVVAVIDMLLLGATAYLSFSQYENTES